MVVAMAAGYEAKRRRRLAEEENEDKQNKAEEAALEERRDVHTSERDASAIDERNGTVFANKSSTGALLSNIRRRNLFGN